MTLRARAAWLLRVALGLAAVLVVLGSAAYQLAAHSSWGREQLRRLLLAQLEPVLAGQIQLAEISRVGLSGLSLRGLAARDPRGADVLEVESLELSWSLPALLGGAIELERVALWGARVDLGDLSAQRGLLAAFALREPPQQPAPAAELARLELSELSVEGLSLAFERPGLGRWAAQNLSLRGSYRQGKGREAELTAFACELWRDGARLGSVDSASAHYASAGPSRLELAIRVADSQLTLRAEGRTPGDPEFETAPLALSVQLEHVSAATFTALGLGEVGSGWGQPLALRAALNGSVRAPHGNFRLSAPAGVVSGEASWSAERVAQLRLVVEGLALSEAYAGLPSGRLRGVLDATARLAEAPGVPLELRFAQGQLDELPLPELVASARLFPDRVRELSLSLEGYGGRAELHGDADFSGQGQGSLRVALPRLERLPQLPGLGLPAPARGSLELRSELTLRPERLAARGSLSLQGLTLPEFSLGSLHGSFEVAGSLQAPRLEAQLQAAALHAGRIRVDQARAQLDVSKLPDGVLAVFAADGSALGQRLTLSGRYGRAGMQGLVLDAPALDLARLSSALGLWPPLSGTVALRASARGQLAAPLLEVSVRGDALTVGGLPALGLPVAADASLQLQLRGSVREPELDAELRARLPELAPGRRADLQLVAQYARGRARAKLSLSDPDGAWLAASAQLEHPEATSAALLRDAARLLERGVWQAQLDVAPRRMGLLPRALAVPGAPANLELGAELAVSHAAGQEPEARLRLRVRQPGSAGASGACSAAAAELDLDALLRSGRLAAQLAVERGPERLAHVTARSGLELSASLAGSGPVRLEGLELDASFDDVELASLPYVCNRIHGRVRGTATARDLLSPSPELVVALEAARLSLDRRQFVDARLNASVQLPRARVGLVLEHGGSRSTLDASLPLHVEGGRVVVPAREPLSARLVVDHLPLAAVVPPDAPISRVSGSLSGRLELGGTRAAPELRGELLPEAVGFTATALAQPLSDVTGRLVIDKNTIEIERLSARDGEGRLTASGRLEWTPATGGADASASLTLKEFPLRQQGRVAGELDARLRVNVALNEQAARVAIQLDDVSLWLRGGDLRQGIDLEPHPDLIDPRARPRSAPAVAASPLALPFELSLDAGDSVWVQREDFAAKLSAKLSASSKQGQFRLHGPVLLRRGYLQLLGKVFELQDQSRIEFVGSDPPDPVLDIRAVANTRGQGQRVRVEITGRARSPQLEFFVEDQAVSAGKAAEALFASGASSGAATAQAQSFVGGLSGGLLALSARRELGEMMPILLVEPATESSGSRLRAGFELDSLVPAFLRSVIRGVYVEGIIASDTGQQQQDTGGGVLLELYLPHDLVASGQYGPGETWSLDLGWEP